jgi:hypothetical protein
VEHLNYLCSDADQISNGCNASSPDRAAHGGEELVAWLLDRAKAYEQANKVRVLHYLDLHYYPQGGNVPDNTRSLWDPNYTGPSCFDSAQRNSRVRTRRAPHVSEQRHELTEVCVGPSIGPARKPSLPAIASS